MKRREANRRRLTDLSIARMRPPAIGTVIVWDTLVPAFGARLSATGRRTWIVAVRRPGEKHPVRLRLEPQPTTVAAARAAAREMLAAGGPRAPVLVGDLIERFLEHGRTRKGEPWRPETERVYRTVLRNAARPLHDRPVHSVSRADIAALTSTIANGSTGAMPALSRSCLRRFWHWLAETDDQLDRNPVVYTPRYVVARRTRILSPAEIARLWTVTEEPSDFHLIVRLLLWLGCRRSEAGGLRWSELSPDGTTWTLPPERTKNGVALMLPIAKQTRAAIAAWPRRPGRDHLFGECSTAGFTCWAQEKRKLDRKLRFNNGFVLHDLRRTVESGMASRGIPKDHVNRTMNHAVPDVTKNYDLHDYFREKQAALQAWADHLEKTVS